MKKTVFQMAEMEGQHAVCTFWLNACSGSLLWICPRETSVRIQVFYIADRVWNNEVET